MVNVLRYFGFGREATFGTAVDASAHVDIASTTLDSPNNPEIAVRGSMGRSTFRKRPGYYSPSGGVSYDFDIETIGFMLQMALKGYGFTADEPSEGINLHEIYGTNDATLDFFTAHLGKDVFEHVFNSCVINQLTMKVDGGLAACDINVLTQKDAKAVLKSTGDLLLPDAYPLAFQEVTASLNSSDVSAKCRSITLDINNSINADSGKTIGSMFPRRFKAGDRAVTANLVLEFLDTDMFTLFWGNATAPSTGGSTTAPLTITYDASVASAAGHQMVAYIPTAWITALSTQPSGRDTILQTVNVRALMTRDVALNDASTIDTDVLFSIHNAEGTLVS